VVIDFKYGLEKHWEHGNSSVVRIELERSLDWVEQDWKIELVKLVWEQSTRTRLLKEEMLEDKSK
jgi:hypothetical protein